MLKWVNAHICVYIYIYTNTHFISNVSYFNTHTCSSFSLLPKLYCCELPHSPYSKPTRPLVYIASSLEALVECGLLTKHVADIANIDTNRKNDMAELININNNCNHGLSTIYKCRIYYSCLCKPKDGCIQIAGMSFYQAGHDYILLYCAHGNSVTFIKNGLIPTDMFHFLLK